MREAARRWAIRGAWALAIASAAMLAGLRLGRPLYYTDGHDAVAASDLATASMARLQQPEPVCELPGPVVGRVAALPDGRLLYGRAIDGDTELVTFDPSRPGLPAERVLALSSPGHDLAPAVDAEGNVWFASDREGGVGGYDLWFARATPRGFAPPEPVAACNTMLDETDPAPTMGLLVFARVRRGGDGGGVLWRWRPGSALDPVPVFGDERKAPATDRDPAFAADGSALWFLRREPGRPAVILRSSVCAGAFDRAVPAFDTTAGGELRSPLPSPGGFGAFLLRPRAERSGSGGDEPGGVAADVWLQSRARELAPFWLGQRWLETLLFTLLCAAAALLLLLHLGRRWRSLDLVTLCLLLSLLVHLLLMLWLMGVEIVGRPVPSEDDGAGTTIAVLVDAGAGAPAAADGAQRDDIAQLARYEFARAAIATEAPAAAMQAVARAPLAASEADAAERPVAEASADTATEPSPALQDAAAELAVRDGTDAERAVAASAAAAVAARADAPAVERNEAAAETIVVRAPGRAEAAMPRAERVVAAAAAAPPALAVAPGAASSMPAPSLVLEDAADRGRIAALRSGVDAAAAAEPKRPSAFAQPRDAGTEPATEREVRAGTAGPVALDAPSSSLSPSSSSGGAVAAAPAALPDLPPAPAGAARPAPRLSDAPSVAAAAPSAGGAAETRAVPVAAAAAPAVAPAAPSSVRSERDPAAGTASPAPATMPAPDSALRRSGAAVPVAAADTAALPVPRGSAAAARPVLRDGGAPAPTPAATTPAAAPLAAATGRTPAPARPDTLAAPRQDAGAAADARRDLAAPAGALGAPVVAAPTSGLVAADSAVPLPAAALPMPQHTAARVPSPSAALRDPLATTAVRGTPDAATPARTATPTRAATTGAAPRVPAPLAGPLATAAQPADRPARAQRFGLEPLGALPVPGSSLVRATPAPIALGAAPAAPVAASPYSNRFGPAKERALREFGGTDETERAVRDGLRYLARIQRRDGAWGNPDQWDTKYGRVYVGKTALCVLAFLGAGHSPSSRTEHSAVVKRAIDHLLAIQDETTGAFGPSSAYGHGIATYALTECYGLTKDEGLLQPVERALAWILDNQGPRRDRRNRGGWGYFSPGLRPEDDYARSSISAWMVMALESARLAGIELPEDVLPRAREFFEQAFDRQQGFFRYNHMRSRLQSGWPTLPASTPAAAFCLLLLGAGADDEEIATAVRYTAERRPEEYRRYSDDDFVQRGQGNVYFWYYGTLCCFLAGGESWQRWNERLSTLLPSSQDPDGSFAPIDVYARYAGDDARDRSYTTAMCVLSLEVYYRYFTPLLVGRDQGPR